MLDSSQSGCVNHPTVQAAVRCKQCSRPICTSCIVPGPTGRFCSTSCKEKHEHFIRAASDMDSKARGAFFVRFRRMLTSLLMAAVVVGLVLFVATLVEIPVLSGIALRVRAMLGL